MLRAARPALLWLALTLAAPAGAQAGQTVSLAAGAQPAAARLGDIGWLVGRWVGEGGGFKLAFTIAPAEHGMMVGTFTVANDQGVRIIELQQFSEEKGSIMFRLKHFGPDLKGQEEKDVSIDRPLVALKPDRIEFDTVTMIRGADGQSMQEFFRVKTPDGAEREIEFRFRRQ